MNAAVEKDTPEAEESPEISAEALSDAPSGGAEGQQSLESREILEVVGEAVRDHMEWLHRFHRAVVCHLSPERDVISDQAHYLCAFGAWLDLHKGDRLVTQPAFATLVDYHGKMHAVVRRVAMDVAQGKKLRPEAYDDLTDVMSRFFEQSRRIREAFHQARSDLDPLTGLHNRQIMFEELDRERERFLRTGETCCIALADLDYFKQVNDNHGHAAGDQVLTACAARFIENLRPYDMVFRYGGEEFLICMPNAESETAMAILERLRKAMADEPVVVENGDQAPRDEGPGKDKELRGTVSFGLAILEHETSLKQTMARADEALYQAKGGGRNRVCLWNPSGEGGEGVEGGEENGDGDGCG